MKRPYFPSLAGLLAGISLLCALPAEASEGYPSELYLGAGGGIQHTHGLAFQVAVPVAGRLLPADGRVEAQYTRWRDGRHVAALGAGYRFEFPAGFSAVIGASYVNRVTDNLLRHANAYLEVRFQPLDRFSCQVGHYSSIGDDTGENVILCGLHWALSP